MMRRILFVIAFLVAFALGGVAWSWASEHLLQSTTSLRAPGLSGIAGTITAVSGSSISLSAVMTNHPSDTKPVTVYFTPSTIIERLSFPGITTGTSTVSRTASTTASAPQATPVPASELKVGEYVTILLGSAPSRLEATRISVLPQP